MLTIKHERAFHTIHNRVNYVQLFSNITLKFGTCNKQINLLAPNIIMVQENVKYFKPNIAKSSISVATDFHWVSVSPEP